MLWEEAVGRWTAYLIIIFLALLMLNGCSVIRIPIPLIGARADIAALEGQWYGSYSSMDTGRSGSITFELTVDADTASGDVTMYPLGWEDWYGTEDTHGTLDEQAPQRLTIDFVQTWDGRVAGRLSPYRDPVSGCMLHTVFEGHIRGDTIEGTFEAHGVELALVQTGSWSVTRKRSVARK